MELLRSGRDLVRVGHRGAAALAPENSLAAIEAAAGCGVDAVELDVCRRGDGTLVLAHEPEPPAHAPLLDDALACAADTGVAVQLDVKAPGLERGVADALRRHALLERSFVSACSLGVLAAFAREAPELARSLTYPQDRLGVAGSRVLRPVVRTGLAALSLLLPRRLPPWLRAVEASAATLNWTVVTPAVVSACHAVGAAVYAWTVNEPEVVRALVETGIDGIITDDPRILASSALESSPLSRT